MRQVLIRALALFRVPVVWAVVALVALGGSLLVRLPLFGVPGFELSLALALAVGLLGGLVGIAAGRQERRLIEGRDPRPPGALRIEWGMVAVLAPFAAASLVLMAALIPPLVTSIIYALISTRCDPFSQVGFFPWLTLPSAVLAASAGVFCALTAKRFRGAVLFYVGLVVLSAIWTVWPLVFGPQVFAFNFFGGWFPGPLYDEALSVGSQLVWFRLETLLWAGLLLGAAALFLRMRDGRLGRPHLRPGAIFLLAACALGIGWIEQAAHELGLRSSRGYVESQLGGTQVTPHFEIHFPAGKPARQVQRLARDLEFRWSRNLAFLGGAPKRKIRVFIYRSAEQKHRLVGAGQTDYAKPWLRSVHVNDAPFPNAVLSHELIHVMAAPFGSGPFRLTTRWGVPQMAVVEGMAVAGADAHSVLTLHQWAEALRQEKLAPDLVKLFGGGFYGQPASRAYVSAGSFLRWLDQTYGQKKIQKLYAHADFQKVYGQSLATLVQGWEKFLDTVKVSPAERHRAFARFRQGSLFTRSCAREVADLQTRAEGALRSNPDLALALYGRCAALQPNEPGFRMGQARALLLLGKPKQANTLLATLETQVKAHPALAAEVGLERAEALARQSLTAKATKQLESVLALNPAPAIARTAQVRIAALKDPSAAASVKAYFDPDRPDLRLWRLQRAVDAHPGPIGQYLLGRLLAQDQVGTAAAQNLDAARTGELGPLLTLEATRLELKAQFLAGACNQVKTIAAALPKDATAALKADANEWSDRCDFEQRRYGGPLAPEGDLR